MAISTRRSVLAMSLLAAALLSGCRNQDAAEYDLVLHGGRVMDPESGLDGVRDVGIQDGRIEAVSEQALQGKRVVDVAGLVVAPGFIDLHAHGQTDESFRLMAQDGVTTAFELEVGAADIQSWYAARENGQVLNYGASIGHIPVRMAVLQDPGEFLPSGPAASRAATEEEIAEIKRRIEAGLDQGAVAVGFGMAYTPAASLQEFETMMRVAAERRAPAHIHVKTGLDGLSEAIETARTTGAALHVVHANSSGGAETAEFLARIEAARAAGQDVTTEAYPYEAGMTSIQSSLFDDWESWDEARYATHQWAETGERLTRESFARYRQQGGNVIIHSRTEEMTRTAIAHPLTMIASDGFLVNGKGHPRTSGTYAKVLGRYVREQGTLTLMDALRRMTVEPARRLETYVPAMARKGRVRAGADADLTVFDARTIIDRSTYTSPTTPSAGVRYLLVHGAPVVEEGRLVEGARPGRAVRNAAARR